MSWKSLVNRAVKIGINEGMKYLKESKSSKAERERTQGNGQWEDVRTSDYPGDFRGTIHAQYAPDLDGSADPGEVVWGWVPFEEDHSQGKDRPALVIGSDGPWALVLMLTSKDNIPGGRGEVREHRHARWMNIGTGDWDREGRPSEIRLDRVIRLDPDSIRREGAIMPRETFELIAAEVRSN